MATQNLLQRLDTAAETTGSSVNVSDRRIEEVFICAETNGIASGDCVALDLSQTDNSDKVLKVVKANTGAGATILAIGIALEAASNGDNIRVCVRGICSANVDANIAAGNRLQAGATDGRLFAAVDIDEASTSVIPQLPIVAYAVGAEANNVADVYVLPQF
jgi:hypothetical protein